MVGLYTADGYCCERLFNNANYIHDIGLGMRAINLREAMQNGTNAHRREIIKVCMSKSVSS